MNELLLRRRLAQISGEHYTADDYIQDGLVLLLDGPDYDGGSTWTDRKGGKSFTKNKTVSKEGKGVYCNGGYFECTSGISVSQSAGTIEVVADRKKVSTANEYMFMRAATGQLVYAVNTSKYVLISNFTPNQNRVFLDADVKVGKFVHSINNTVNYFNGVSKSYTGTGSASRGGGAISVGGISSGYYFYGVIYCIRVYNRKLSAEEMLFNQHIDNVRFGLGLTI